MNMTVTTTISFKIPEEYDLLQKFEKDNEVKLAEAKRVESTNFVTWEVVSMFSSKGGDTE